MEIYLGSRVQHTDTNTCKTYRKANIWVLMQPIIRPPRYPYGLMNMLFSNIHIVWVYGVWALCHQKIQPWTTC